MVPETSVPGAMAPGGGKPANCPARAGFVNTADARKPLEYVEVARVAGRG